MDNPTARKTLAVATPLLDVNNGKTDEQDETRYKS